MHKDRRQRDLHAGSRQGHKKGAKEEKRLTVPWKKGDRLLYYGQLEVTVVSVNRTSLTVKTEKETFATDPCFLSAAGGPDSLPPSPLRNGPEKSGIAVPKRKGTTKKQ